MDRSLRKNKWGQNIGKVRWSCIKVKHYSTQGNSVSCPHWWADFFRNWGRSWKSPCSSNWILFSNLVSKLWIWQMSMTNTYYLWFKKNICTNDISDHAGTEALRMLVWICLLVSPTLIQTEITFYYLLAWKVVQVLQVLTGWILITFLWLFLYCTG